MLSLILYVMGHRQPPKTMDVVLATIVAGRWAQIW